MASLSKKDVDKRISIKKDIFVDDCVAVRLENPIDESLKEFLEWLFLHGTLVITNKILHEYNSSLNAGSSNFIAVLNSCTKDNRVHLIDNIDLKKFRFNKKIERNLLSNKKDWWHIKAVLLSPRKIAISFDKNFIRDINDFPGYVAHASRRISDLPFR